MRRLEALHCKASSLLLLVDILVDECHNLKKLKNLYFEIDRGIALKVGSELIIFPGKDGVQADSDQGGYC